MTDGFLCGVEVKPVREIPVATLKRGLSRVLFK